MKINNLEQQFKIELDKFKNGKLDLVGLKTKLVKVDN
jgi:hypothetical protein